MEMSTRAQRRQFVEAYASGSWSMTELCERHGITRPTGYKWVARWTAEGEAGLDERPRQAGHCPHQIAPTIAAHLVAARRTYGWGAGKLLAVLRRRHPDVRWPTRSTVNALLDRHGLLQKQRRRRVTTHPGAAPLHTTAPNQVWPADFKGQFKTRDGAWCFPLTVTDHFSRTILLCEALPSVRTQVVQPAMRRLFEAVGLPDAIRTDNGVPFASTGLHGLTPLNVWWMQLGIIHQRIRPGHPQANGTHERMHRELKRETQLPAAADAGAQQRRFDAFRQRYNDERPHAALDDQTPATRWTPSARAYPRHIVAPEYPAHFLVRQVRRGGTIKYRGRAVFLSEALDGQRLGLEPVGDGIWDLVFYRTVLGRFDERTGRLTAG